jgi:predicted GNAT family acetyltransferase
MHPEIQELLGSLQGLLSDFGDLSNFFVCRMNDLVVAVADTIVSSCGHTAIQQVFTASEYRNRGIASVLVAHLVNRIILLGGVALYICDADNMASAKTAERAGFSLTARLANVKIVP